jgi:hypothetical protein
LTLPIGIDGFSTNNEQIEQQKDGEWEQCHHNHVQIHIVRGIDAEEQRGWTNFHNHFATSIMDAFAQIELWKA